MEQASNPTLSELFTGEERRVWYAVFDDIGKDSEIYSMYVVENGMVTSYSMTGHGVAYVLGNLSGHTDDAMIEAAEGDIQESYEKHGELYSSIEEMRSYRVDDDQTPQFTVNTDQTGNNVISETVSLAPGDESYTVTLEIAAEGSEVSGQVYEDMWKGFEMIPEHQYRMRYVVTRDPSYSSFSLDGLNSPGVMVN